MSTLVVQPMQWATMKDIHDIEPLSNLDSEVLRDLREVLIKHNAVDRFGITLIHKHFDVADNEQLVEFTDIKNRRLVIEPISAKDTLETIETTWRFSMASSSGPHPLTVCLTRCYYDPKATPPHASGHTRQ